ncbi:MAG TPA: capsule assembly Wzi family protein [Steroidobacteraceae bacterium]|nr:capsule assembly Wzi family protein [Steroidobacteraceae bacterium]
MRIAMLAALLLGAAVGPAAADAGWFEQGDTMLRNDLLLLNDAAVIRLPVNQWPMPRAAVRYAMENGKAHVATNQAVIAALDRVRARLDAAAPVTRKGFALDASIAAGKAGLLRDFDTVGRENGELSGRAIWSTGERAEFSLNAALVADPDDGDEFRIDGSHASVLLGNWLLSANTLDRWWGPAHESSLILSNNARPMPTIMVERATARPFESRWLSWLGPWTMNFGLSRMESEREDIDAPLFMAWRIAIMPFRDVEIGFSRTAQFCGEGLPCDLQSLWDMMIGNDNPGFDATPESEPGNQMAGFDLRWNSPIGNWPYAIYSQYIGEDESSYVPAKYLAQVGVEIWKPMADGGLLQTFAEYSTTTCSANSGSGPYYNCAYNQGQFNVEGYRYKGRVIGYTADRDAENYALGATFTTAGGELWSATARTSRLNRDDYGDVRNTVAAVPTDYNALEFGWKGRLFGEYVEVDLGVESIEPDGGERDVNVFGFVRWSYAFAP